MRGIEVQLTAYEIFMAASVGVRRRIASYGGKQTNKVQNKDFGWHTDIEGACAEMAFAKAMGVYWDYSAYNAYNLDKYQSPDVLNYEIKHTQHTDGCLIIRPGYRDEQQYVLVTGTSPAFCVRGWLYGKDGMDDKYLRYKGEPGEAWFVPQYDLEVFDL